MAINKKQKENAPSGKNSAESTPKYEEVHFVDSTKPVWNYSLFTERILKISGTGPTTAYTKIWHHIRLSVLDKDGYYFAVWAPNATAVSVVGDFNNWDRSTSLICAAGKIRYMGRVYSRYKSDIQVINIILKGMKTPNCIKEIHTQIIGN